MISLFIDTSNFRLIIGVINEEKNIVLSYYNEKLNGDLSCKVFDVLKKCIDNSGITPKEIKKIYSVVGPGSFTGVRIGVTICKTFAWAQNIEVIPLSSLEVLATTKIENKYIVSAIDARRDCVFAGVYDKNLNTIIEDEYIAIKDLENKIRNLDYIVVTDDDISLFEKKIQSDVDLLKIVNKHKFDSSVNPHALNPIYLKITEAEANKRKND